MQIARLYLSESLWFLLFNVLRTWLHVPCGFQILILQPQILLVEHFQKQSDFVFRRKLSRRRMFPRSDCRQSGVSLIVSDRHSSIFSVRGMNCRSLRVGIAVLWMKRTSAKIGTSSLCLVQNGCQLESNPTLKWWKTTPLLNPYIFFFFFSNLAWRLIELCS